MNHVIFLPGLGADFRLFDFIKPGNYQRHFIKWIKPKNAESIQSYLQRIKEQVDFDKPPILVGVSLGGMMAMELREMMPVKKTILISSVKTKAEMPNYFNLVKKSKLNEIISPSLIKMGAPLIKPFVTSGFDKKAISHFKSMLKDSDDEFIHWSLQLVLDWNRTAYSKDNLVHIHGSKDIVFPLKYIKQVEYVIKGGTHDMVMTSAEEINEILKVEL